MTLSTKQLTAYREDFARANNDDERDAVLRSVYHLIHAGEQNITTVGMSSEQVKQAVEQYL